MPETLGSKMKLLVVLLETWIVLYDPVSRLGYQIKVFATVEAEVGWTYLNIDIQHGAIKHSHLSHRVSSSAPTQGRGLILGR